MKSLIAQFLIVAVLINLGFTTVFAQKNAKPKNLREVVIYLLKDVNEGEKGYDPENNPLNLFPVKRQVDANAPLAGALKALVKGATEKEESQKYNSSTSGMKFVSVSLQNGKFRACFTQPEGASFGGDFGEDIFEEAVRKTAMQFKGVKEVIIC